jgi:tyrosyl-tRNA synthetase
MSISDELMWKYWTLLTDLRASEIAEMQEKVAAGALHPMQAKKNLAWGIVRDFHSDAAADAAAESWAKQFQQRAVAQDAPVVKISLAAEGLVVELGLREGSVVRVPKLLQLAGLASSTGEATRKLGENAVSVNGEKFSEKLLKGAKAGGSVALRLGKKSVRVEWVR